MEITTMIRHLLYLASSVILCCTYIQADEIELSSMDDLQSIGKSVKAGKELKQVLDFGFANTTGDAETLNINAKYALSFTTIGYNEKALKVALDTSVFISETETIRDNEEYKFNLGLEQFVYEKWLGYASVNWLRNEFQNYDIKLSLGAGVGKEIVSTKKDSLTLKIGLAYNLEGYTNGQEDDKYVSLNEYIEYKHTFNDVSSLYLQLGSLQNVSDFSDFDVNFIGGLSFKVAENISLTLEEEIRYDKIPPVGFDSTNTKTIIRIGYNF